MTFCYTKMKTVDFSQRLKTIRHLFGLSMEQLVQQMNVPISRQSIYKYESGAMHPKPEVMQELCRVLRVDSILTEGHSFHLSPLMPRLVKGGKITTEVYQQLCFQVCAWLERYINDEKATGQYRKFVRPDLIHPAKDAKDAEEAASRLRDCWKIGECPIPSILRMLERKGIRFFETSLPTQLLGLSLWADNIYPVIVLNNDWQSNTVERLRFTVAHELGHLLLNFADGADEERICNQFAGCLLMPRNVLYEEIGEKRDFLTLDELIDLREQYGVSISALIHQAFDLGIISRKHYDWWYEEQIHLNIKEEGWGAYAFTESLGRHRRIQSIMTNKENQKL